MKFATASEAPIVSICLMTYNHEPYIKKAIESVLMQETSFACEFIIAEDCSTDNTRHIIQSYADKFPIKVILNEKNVGVQRNLKKLLDEPVGKYVAFFEGDDYWIDPLKLQKQFNILEASPEIALCYSNAKIYDTRNPKSNIYFKLNGKPDKIMPPSKVVTSWFGPTCTIFFRNLIRPIPDWIVDVKACDHLLVSLACKYGGAYYHDENLGLYTHHYAGLSRVVGNEQYLIADFKPWFYLYDHYNKEEAIWDAIIYKGHHDLNRLLRFGLTKKARSLFWKWPLRRLLWSGKHRSQTIKLGIKLHTPYYQTFKKSFKKNNSPKAVNSKV